MDDATKARIVEAGARAMTHENWDNLHAGTRARYRSDARACLSAALAAAEAEGVMLVPTDATPAVYSAILNAQFSGATTSEIYSAATLAGKVTL
jgi:hypothetical protein